MNYIEIKKWFQELDVLNKKIIKSYFNKIDEKPKGNNTNYS